MRIVNQEQRVRHTWQHSHTNPQLRQLAETRDAILLLDQFESICAHFRLRIVRGDVMISSPVELAQELTLVAATLADTFSVPA